MTLVEVLIALAIISMVFTYITTTTFEYLKRVKVLEQQDQMLSLASEAVELLQKEKATSWSALMNKFPSLNSSALISYPAGQITGTIQAYNGGCSQPNIASNQRVFTPETTDCTELRQSGSGQSDFARIITLINPNVSANTRTYAQYQIVVACVTDTCDPSLYNPFVLTTYVYKTANN